MLGCRGPTGTEVSLTIGGASETLVVRSAFAEYVELPGHESRLLVTLANYSVGCDEVRPPGDSETLVTLLLRRPSPEAVTPGEYHWQTPMPLDKGLPEPGATPFLRRGRAGRELGEGGSVTLSVFEPKAQGRVEGRFSFLETESEGGNERQAGLRGEFRVRLCRAALDPARAAEGTP